MVNHPNRSRRRAIEFITLTTGSTTIHQRREIEQATMAMAADLLRGREPDGWGVDLTNSHPTSHVYDVLWKRAAVSSCYLCVAEAASHGMWEAAETLGPPRTVLHRPRGVPWLAAAIMPAAIAMDRDLLMALPWLELAIAWQLIESRGDT